jgi:hypothetical protein
MRRVGVLVLLVPALAFAGGDYVPGKVTNFSGEDGIYSFTFAADGELVGPEACQMLKVNVEYAHVRWYSWMPFIRTSHPTKKQTELAAAVLREADQKSKSILFGYLGLALERDADREFVLSFHDPA